MKKIWIPILLLILLILFCLWNSDSKFNKPIEYTIKQYNKTYVVNGKFSNRKQEESIYKLLHKNGVREINVTREEFNGFFRDFGSMPVVEKIIPSFVKNYKRGEIEYKNKTLTIKGEVRDKSIKKSIDDMLADTKINYSDQTVVIKPSPIEFAVVGNDGLYELSGLFSNSSQLELLQQSCEATGKLKSTSGVINEDLVDAEGALPAVVKIMPIFMKKYADGKLEYKDKVLTISGKVENLSDRDLIQSYLPKSPRFKIADNTTLDVEKIKAKKRAEEARQKALKEAQAKAALQEKMLKQAQAEKARLEAEIKEKEEKARLEAEMRAKAKLEAENKAKEEQARLKSAQEKAEKESKAKLDQQKKVQAAENIAKAKEQSKKKPNTSKSSKEMKEKVDALLADHQIKFYYGSSRLNRVGRRTVRMVSSILKEYPSVKIEIAGHTDSIGSDAYNMNLSQDRVKTVKRRLQRYGIDENRMKAVGYGETKPLYPNNTRSHRRKNRRVEINILGE